MKHAAATEVSLQFVQHNNQVLLSIEDDGNGFDKNAIEGKGIGLQNIQNRVSTLNGHLSIEATKGKGTFISIEVPIENNNKEEPKEKRQGRTIVLPSWLGF